VDEQGLTLLHLAAVAGQTEVVQTLLAAKANAKAATDDGHTPLHMAAQEGHSEVVQLLLAAGAIVKATTAGDEHTPLHVAALGGHAKVVQLLLAAGASTWVRDSQGCTPAQMGGGYEVHMLLDAASKPKGMAGMLLGILDLD
jgi:ankyrin repeat protein